MRTVYIVKVAAWGETYIEFVDLFVFNTATEARKFEELLHRHEDEISTEVVAAQVGTSAKKAMGVVVAGLREGRYEHED